MNVVAITIGNREIEFDDENFTKISNCREKGQFLLDNFSQIKDKIKFPIIQPFLNELDQRNVQIDKVILITTDQKDERYKDSDSINFAEVIKKNFERKKVEIILIKITDNVNDFMSNYKFFQNKLNNIKYEDIDKFYLLPVGGMPNINTPLILTTILYFKEKIVQYCVDQKQENAYPVPFNLKFLKEIENDMVKPALKSFYFASISNISSNTYIKRISEYAYNRLSFNLEKAKIIIDDLIMDFPDENLRTFSESIVEIMKYHKKKIEEIFFSAIIKIKQKQYVDALLRLYNFTDNLLLQKVCEYYNLEYDPQDDFTKWWDDSIKKIKNNNPQIEDNLEKINNVKAKLEKHGIPLYNALIKFKEKKNDVFEITNPLQAISKLRNKSIAAHGFEGVSLERISNELKEYELDLNGLIEKIEKYLNISFEDSIYNKICEIIKKKLK